MRQSPCGGAVIPRRVVSPHSLTNAKNRSADVDRIGAGCINALETRHANGPKCPALDTGSFAMTFLPIVDLLSLTFNIEGIRFAGAKPMNCPGGVLVYKEERRSYRELPMRALPVPFCLKGFFPPPDTSFRVFVEAVPERLAASCATTA